MEGPSKSRASGQGSGGTVRKERDALANRDTRTMGLLRDCRAARSMVNSTVQTVPSPRARNAKSLQVFSY